MSCIWNCKVEDRHCGLCLYCGKCERVTRSILEDDSEAEACIEVMNGIVGCDIRIPSRTTPVRWGRYFVAYKLRRDGYSLCRIGRILDREHTSIMNALKKVDNAMENPKTYADVMPIWNSFTEKLSLHKTITV